MKKFILSAIMALSCGALFAAEPTDMYLYWMIDEGASFKDKSGVAETVTIADYTARISYGEGSWLDLYTVPGGTKIDGKDGVNAENVFGWEMVAAIGDHNTGSFFVELVKDNAVAYKSESMSYDALAGYMSSSIGMATPADTYGFSSFSAVPEPTSGLLLLLGVAGLALRRKKMQKA